MNWYKKSQLAEYTQNNPSSIQLVGSGLNQTINISGKTISAKDILNKSISLIGNVLKNNYVNKIDTSPVAVSNAWGIAKSNEPGVIHVDVTKIFNDYKVSLPPVTQLDGVTLDTDVFNGFAKELSSKILEVTAHESQHMNDYRNLALKNQPFSNATEQSAVNFGEKTREAYKGKF